MPTPNRLLPSFLGSPEPTLPYAPAFRLVSTLVGGHRLMLSGDLDLASIDRLRRVLDSIPVASDGQPLIFDLTEATYLDCATLRVLLDAKRMFGQRQTVAFRFAPTGQPRRMVALLGLEETLNLRH